MKRFGKLLFICWILLLVISTHVFAQETPTCGKNVKYRIVNETIYFFTNGETDAMWTNRNNNCGDVFKNNSQIKKVVIEEPIKVFSPSETFLDFTFVEEMDLREFVFPDQNPSFQSMFKGCNSLKKLNLNGWDTSNVKHMGSMFTECENLVELKIDGWNTENVTNMEFMFMGCSSLTTLDISNWNTSNVTKMNNLFDCCSSLTTMDLSNWKTSNVTDMSQMFDFYDNEDEPVNSSLTTLNLSGWDTSSVTDMRSMFMGASSLKTLILGDDWKKTSKVESMSEMFRACSSLTDLDLSGWNTSSVEEMYAMFADCSSLVSLNLSDWNVSSVGDMTSMFLDCESLITLDVSGWTIGEVDMWDMFDGCSSLTALDVSSWDTTDIEDWEEMFYGCNSLKTLTLGESSLEQIIFDYNSSYFPNYNATWYYVKTDTEIATDPEALKEGDTLSNGALFTGYNAAKMAGTWSTTYDPEYTITLSNVEDGNLGDMGNITYTYDSTSEKYSGTYKKSELNPSLKMPEFPTKDGYTFAGWTGEGLTAINPVEITTENAGNKEYTAEWVKNPVITTQPENLYLTYGYKETEGSLTVTAEAAADHSLSYQWYQCKDNSYTNCGVISGKTDSSYVISTGKTVGTEYYYCQVTSSRTGITQTASANSSIAAVTVQKADPSFSVSMDDWTFGETAKDPEIKDGGTTGDGAVSYTYYTDAECTAMTSAANSGATADGGKPVWAGTWYVRASVPETDLYNAFTTKEAASFTIAKAAVTPSPSDVEISDLYTITSKTAALPEMSSDAGTLSYSTGEVSVSGQAQASAVTENGVVTISLSGGADGDEIKVPVTISSTNYQDVTLNVVLTLGPKADAVVSYEEGSSQTVTFGENLTLHAKAENEGPNGKWTWKSSDESIATVDSSGAVTIMKAGVVEITAEYESDTTVGSAKFALTVKPKTTAAPVFSPAGGNYTDPQSVTITCETEGAVIHFTTDGSEPTADSPVYSGPIPVTESLTIKAISVKDGMSDSAVVSAVYTIIPVPKSYTVTVENGTGSGSYTAGTVVSITADAAPAGETFDRWTSDDGVEFTDASSASTGFVMPAKDVTVTAAYKSEPMTLNVVFVNVDQSSSYGVPKEIPDLAFPGLVISIDAGDYESQTEEFTLELSAAGQPTISKPLQFDRKVEQLAPGSHPVTISGLPPVVYGTLNGVFLTEPPAGEVILWKYTLSARTEINVKTDGSGQKIVYIRLYLTWDNGSSMPEEPVVRALPEDEIGAYKLNEDGTKEYLLFHTYSLCMDWLGRDELCRGYERCFHKENPYVNPFVTP